MSLPHRSRPAQLLHFFAPKPSLLQNLIRMLANFRNGPRCRTLRPTETRRRRRLRKAAHLDEDLTAHVVGMMRRFTDRERRCKTSIGTFQQLAPLIASPAAKDFGQPLLQPRPTAPVVLPRDVAAVQTDPLR